MRMSGARSGGRGILLGTVAAALVLAPFASVAFSYRVSLYLQASLVLFLTGGLIVFLWRRPIEAWHQARSAPRLLWVGVLLYAGAALQGLLVAFAEGNDLRRVAGQFLAMIILPGAAIGVFAIGEKDRWNSFALGLVAGTAGAATIDLLHWFWSYSHGRTLLRLAFANAVNASSTSLLALPFALALAFHRRYRLLGRLLTPLLVLDIVGSGVRSLWLVAVPVVLLFLMVRAGWKRCLSRQSLYWAAAVVVAVSTLAAVIVFAKKTQQPVEAASGQPASIFVGSSAVRPPGRALAKKRGGVVTFAWGSRRASAFSRSSAPFKVRARRMFDLTVCVLPGGEGRAAIEILWLTRTGSILKADQLQLEKRSPTGCVSEAFVSPRGTTAARVVFRGGLPVGLWRIRQMALVDVGSAWVAPITRQLEFEMSRVRSLLEYLHHPSKVDDQSATIQFRWLESLAVVRQFRSSPLLEKIFGHGLGALVPFDTYGFDNRGHWIHYSAVNFIHNFYLFSLYKLGLLGLIAVCGALLSWMLFLILLLRRGLAEPVRSFVLACLVAWLGFAVWSLAAPEILDFRLAPLWGLMIGVAAASRTGRLPEAGDGEGEAGG